MKASSEERNTIAGAIDLALSLVFRFGFQNCGRLRGIEIADGLRVTLHAPSPASSRVGAVSQAMYE
jgi:hypothetical protein